MTIVAKGTRRKEHLATVILTNKPVSDSGAVVMSVREGEGGGILPPPPVARHGHAFVQRGRCTCMHVLQRCVPLSPFLRLS